ncbi:hypothetical protein MKX03_013692, partial [Papaver bracteatum]
MYSRFWRTHSVGALRTEITHINTRDDIRVGYSGVPRSMMSQYPPPTMSSHTYTYDQAGQSMTQLPNIQWDMPFYKDSHEDLVAVPRKPPNLYNFSDINALK